MTENGKRCILVVDDNQDIREGFVLLLELAGYDEVYSAACGEEALLTLASVRPDVLVTDRNMPRMSGEKLAEIAKRIAPEIKIIMITGHDIEAVRKAATAAGVDRILQKPVLIEDLETAIQEVLAPATA